MSDLVRRLEIKSGMMKMGEKIAWGSDTQLMDEAAARITALEQENAKLLAAMRAIWPYLLWTISAESPGYHPTMPSAVDAFKDVMGKTNHEIRLEQ